MRWGASRLSALLLAGRPCLAAICILLAGAATAADDGLPEPVLVPVRPQPSELVARPTQVPLLDITDSGRHLFAVGDRGAILVSNDGRRWAQLQAPVRAALTAVTFVDADHGWAVGHDAAILHTRDGGATWSLQNFQPELEKPLLDVLFLDRKRGFAAGAYGLFYATTDGGESWNEVLSSIRDTDRHIHSLVRLASGRLLLVGAEGLVATSGNAGATWQLHPPPREVSLFAALPRGDKGAVVFGEKGLAWITADPTAARWTALPTGLNANLFGATALPGGEVVMVGARGAASLVQSAAVPERLRRANPAALSAVLWFKDTLLAVGSSGLQVLER